MPKAKTRKSLTNRFRITKNGKVLRRKAFARHLSVGKSAKRLRRLRRPTKVKNVYARKIRKVLGK